MQLYRQAHTASSGKGVWGSGSQCSPCHQGPPIHLQPGSCSYPWRQSSAGRPSMTLPLPPPDLCPIPPQAAPSFPPCPSQHTCSSHMPFLPCLLDGSRSPLKPLPFPGSCPCLPGLIDSWATSNPPQTTMGSLRVALCLLHIWPLALGTRPTHGKYKANACPRSCNYCSIK